MKKLLAFLVLISHVNFAMFIPQVDEIDQVDANGRPVDDINSLYEFIDQVVLGNTSVAPQDEDDDTTRFYHVVKVDNYTFTQQIVFLKRPELAAVRKMIFPECIAARLPSVFFEIHSPPPEA